MSQKSDGPRRAPLFLRAVTPVIRPKSSRKIPVAPKTVFILSTGRTGTVYLADLLNQVDGVVALHEPKPSRVLNAWTTAFLEGKVSADYLATALADKRQKTLAKTRADLYVESNNFIAGFADVLDDVFENPSVIHIVRDPRDFVTSLTNRGDDAGLRRHFNRHVPNWAYVPVGEKRRRLDAYSRAAHRWAAVNRYLSDYGNRSKNYQLFKFEDVFDRQNKTELKRLLKAIGLTQNQIDDLDFNAKPKAAKTGFSLLDRPSDSANKSKHQHMKAWRDWSPADAQRVDDIVRPLMDQYGYGGETDWRDLTR